MSRKYIATAMRRKKSNGAALLPEPEELAARRVTYMGPPWGAIADSEKCDRRA
jgi:hypothetical protein